MPISLRISSYQRLTPGQQERYSSGLDAVTIGRGNDNDFVLPDPQRFMSSVHCRIERKGDQYLLTDLSTNGTFVNDSEQRMERNSSVVLSDSDRIKLGDYEFIVELGEAAVADDGRADDAASEGMTAFDLPAGAGGEPAPGPDDDVDPFADDPEPDPAPGTDDPGERDINTPVSHMDQNALDRGVDIDAILDLEDEEPAKPDTGKPSGFEPIHEPMQTPKGGAEGGPVSATDIPDDWDEATNMPAASDDAPAPPPPPEEEAETAIDEAPAPATQPASAKRAPVGAGTALDAFATAAGLDPGKLKVTDEAAFFARLGEVNRAFAEGMMRALGGRASVKSEFRLDQTLIGPSENNPLKFSPRVEDALLRILRQHDDGAYLHGTEAVREGFEDINAHQVAVMAGMEAALQGVLKRFAPKTLERRLVSNSLLDNILPAAKKAKYWDIFGMMYSEIADEAQDDFQNLFGSEFTQAYEEQMNRLKNNSED